MKSAMHKGIPILGVPLSHPPKNEQGVVVLFGRIQAKFGVRIETIRQGFPDCLARKIRGDTNKIIRIEFEFKSANYNHPTKGCDWIVCWEHNWPDVPKNLRVIELRKFFGQTWRVWLNTKKNDWYGGYDKKWLSNKGDDAVPRQAQVGDLLLIYFIKPRSQIAFVSEITESSVQRLGGLKGKDGKLKKEWFAATKKLCKLKCPIGLDVIKRHKGLKDAGFVRGSLQGSPNVTEHWPELYQLLIKRNPQARKILAEYAPERMDGEILAT